LSNFSKLSEQDEESGINYLVAVIFSSSVDSAEILKPMPSDRWLQALLEFIHFHIHLMSRVSLNRLGDEGRRKLHSKVVPHVFSQVMDATVKASISEKERIDALEIFRASNHDRENIYSRCTKFVSAENPLDGSALFSRLALMIADVCVLPHDETFAKGVIGISYKTYREMNLVTLVEEAGREL